MAFVFLLVLFPSAGALAENQPPWGDVSSSTILSASEYDYPPYSIVTEDQQADGFSVELLRASLEAMGREVSFQVAPWAEVKQMLTDGRVQVLPLVGRTPERETLYDFTFPYLTMHGTIVVRKDNSDIRQVADLKGKQVAVLKDDNAEEFLQRSNLGAEIITTETFEEALRQLDSGEHDAVVIQKLLSLQLMNQHKLSNLKSVGLPLKAFSQSFCFAVRKGDSDLLSHLNEGLSIVIANGTFDHLHKKWFGPIEELESKVSRVIIGGDSNYPPYEFLDENGQPAGYNVELTRAIAREAGLDVIVQLKPWKEIRTGLSEGTIDAVQGMFFSTERDKELNFTSAHTLVSHVIVCRSGSQPLGSMEELKGKSILVMDGDIMHDLAIKFGYSEQLVVVPSQEEALRQLASGQYDCALVAKIPAHYWIEENDWQNLKINQTAIITPEYCYAVPHGNSQLLARLSEGLATLKATGDYREIYTRWLGVYEKTEESFLKVLQKASIVILPILLLLIVALIWTKMLKTKVRLATSKLRQLFDEASYGIALANPVSGLITDCNDAFASMLGMDKRDVIGKLQRQFHPESDADGEVTREFRQHLGEKSGQSLLAKMYKASGDLIDVEIKSKLINLGGKQYLQGFFKEVTKEKQAEKNLRDSEERYRALYDNAPLPYQSLNEQGLIVDVNPNWLTTLGYQRSEVIGKAYRDFLHPDMQPVFDQNFPVLKQCGIVRDVPFKLKHRDGHYITVSLNGSVGYNDDGTVDRTYCVFKDVSEWARVEEERETLIAELKAKTAEQERFIYTVSHDLKSPLVTIGGFLGVIEMDCEAGEYDEIKSNLGIISRATKRMQLLLNELLELSRVGIKTNPHEVVNLADLVNKAIESVAGEIEKSGATIEVESMLPDVKGDPQGLMQVLENLITNAAKFSATNTSAPLINIGIRRDDERLVCYVKDNGLGIDASHTEKIFDIFEKLDKHSIGTGVGLAIVRQIIEKHKGQVWVESDGPGLGSTFCFTLPEVKS